MKELTADRQAFFGAGLLIGIIMGTIIVHWVYSWAAC